MQLAETWRSAGAGLQGVDPLHVANSSSLGPTLETMEGTHAGHPAGRLGFALIMEARNLVRFCSSSQAEGPCGPR